jgi:hypothetical protein
MKVVEGSGDQIDRDGSSLSHPYLRKLKPKSLKIKSKLEKVAKNLKSKPSGSSKIDNEKQDALRNQNDTPIVPGDDGRDGSDSPGDPLRDDGDSDPGDPLGGDTLDCSNTPRSYIDNSECKLTVYLNWCPYSGGGCNNSITGCTLGQILAIDYGLAAIDSTKELDVAYYCGGKLACGYNKEPMMPINSGLGSTAYMQIVSCSEACDYISFTAGGVHNASSSSCNASETVAFPFQVQEFILV